MLTDGIPAVVWASTGVDPVDVLWFEFAPIAEGTGAASGQVKLLTATLRSGSTVRLIRKTFAPLRSGPHAESSLRPDHWAYWRRELIAYQSGVLPAGPALWAPRLYGVVDDALYIEYVGEQQPAADDAALALARWHHADRTSDRPWLARHQLAQRLAVTDLDWSSVDIDHRLSDIWDQRHQYLDQLEALPWAIAHGDFSTGNLRVQERNLVALDWATFGMSPVGFDLAHLALATLDESLLSIYLDGLEGRYGADAVTLGYRVAVSLVGASWAHWMSRRSIPLPAGYVDFLSAHQP